MQTVEGKKSKLNILLALTILTAGTATYLVLYKETALPQLYSGHDQHHEETLHDELKTEHVAATEVAPEPANTPPHDSKDEATREFSSGRYLLVVGSFREEENAKRLQRKLQEERADVVVETIESNVNDEKYYRVVFAASNSYRKMAELRLELSVAGYTDCWVAGR